MKGTAANGTETAHGAALRLDGIMHLIDGIGEGRLWCPESDREDMSSWMDSSIEDIPEGYDILTLGDLVRTCGRPGSGCSVDRDRGEIALAGGIVLRLREARLVMDLGIGACEEMLRAMEEEP